MNTLTYEEALEIYNEMERLVDGQTKTFFICITA